MGFGLLLSPENREVGQKLGLATGCMFTLPILAFYIAQYLCRDFSEPDNWAGGAAIAVTNIIVGIYCYAAYQEDLTDPTKNDNDADQPRVGIYKQRTD